MKEICPISFIKKNEYQTSDYRFIDVTIDVLHTGVNLNNSEFTKEVVDQAIPTIYNTPILGYVVDEDDPDDKDFKGHESEIRIKNGDVRYVYSGNAYGVIPESCNPRWIVKDDGNGVEREYLRVDGLVWTKFNDPVDIFTRDVIKNHSMEVTDMDYDTDDEGIKHIKAFKFDGCCLLSTTNPNINPAMVGSCAVANFSVDSIYSEIKQRLNEYMSIKNGSNNESVESEAKGENKPMENEMNAAVSQDEGKAENENFALSVKQLTEEIDKQLAQVTIPAPWDSDDTIREYWICDITDTDVIVNQSSDNTIQAIPFTKNGDNISLDFEKKRRMKCAYVDWDDSGQDVDNGMVAAIEKVLSEKISEISSLKNSYDEVKAAYAELKPKYDEFVAKEAQAAADAEKAKRDALFSMMDEKIGSDENYEKLKNNSELSYSDLEMQCYAILGRKNAEFSYAVNEKKNKGTVKFGVDGSPQNKSDAAYGGIVERYLK